MSSSEPLTPEDVARHELWLGCPHVRKYGDDGEWQCSPLDFRRDPLPMLVRHVLIAAGVRAATPAEPAVTPTGDERLREALQREIAYLDVEGRVVSGPAVARQFRHVLEANREPAVTPARSDRERALRETLSRALAAMEHTHRQGRLTAALDGAIYEARAALREPTTAGTVDAVEPGYNEMRP
jgi:hypothetical protein